MVIIGSDHAGYKYKEMIKDYLESKGEQVIDLGAFSEESIDYPDIAQEVGEKVRENESAKGVLICGTGIGMAMSANKMRDIRAALATNEYMAEMAREHNDANIVAIGARVIDEGMAKKIVDTFMSTDFLGEERHQRRVEKINKIRH